ncbi:TPA: hypothetical protein ACSTOR_002543 [Staphylococcus aureus]
MAEIIDLEWLKYKKEFIENDGIIDHSKFINSIHFHKSYSTEILNIINCLFKKNGRVFSNNIAFIIVRNKKCRSKARSKKHDK